MSNVLDGIINGKGEVESYDKMIEIIIEDFKLDDIYNKA